MTKQFTQVIGAALLVVGILGFFVKEALGFLNVGDGNPLGLQLHLNTTYNIIHLVISAWGLYAGFAKKPVPATAS